MSKRSLLLCGGWLLSAAATFGLGWSLKPGPESTSNGALSASGGDGSFVPSVRVKSEEAIAAAKRVDGPFLDKYVIGDQISPESMTAAIKEVLGEDDPLKRAALMSALLAQLTPENAKAAWAVMKESRGSGRRGPGGDSSRQLFLNAWGRVDGKAALTELMAATQGEDGEEGRGRGGRGGRGGGDRGRGMMDTYSALTGWATADGANAAAFVDGLEDDRMKGMYMSGVVRGMLVNGVDDAVEYVSNLPEGTDNIDRYMSSIAGEMLEDGVSAATNWVDTLEDAGLKEGAMTRVASEFVREDLQGAVAWVAEHAGESYANDAVEEVAEQWAEQDPQAVIEWGANLPETAQADVYSEALDEWTERDPLAASEYLASMPASAAKDSAVEGFATELAKNDPESALVWAQTIGDESLRNEALTDVAQSWYRQDQAAVEAWLPTSGLSQEAQEAVTTPQGRGWDFGGRGGRGRGR